MFWNGNKCVGCGGGQIYDGSGQCFCPGGMFYIERKCTVING